MIDLYAILGLERECTAAQVKSAYRKKAKTAHPDAGGSQEDFEKVSQAYLVLSDPERRARYDRDGVIDSGSPDNAFGAAINVIVEFMMIVSQQYALGQAGDPCSIDLMKRARGHFHDQIAELKKQRRPIEKVSASLRKIADRMVVKKDANPLVRDAILRQSNAASEPLRLIDQKIKSFEDATVLVDAYGFDIDKMSAPHSPLKTQVFTVNLGGL